MKIRQDVQHQLQVIVQQVEGQTVQYVEVKVIIEGTAIITHILQDTLRYQAVLRVIVV